MGLAPGRGPELFFRTNRNDYPKPYFWTLFYTQQISAMNKAELIEKIAGDAEISKKQKP
jgi:hypothetical protein